MNLKAFLLDEHPISRFGIKALLAQNQIEVVGEASKYLDYLELTQSKIAWNFLILDLGKEFKTGMRIIRETKAKFPDIKVLVFAKYTEPFIVIEAMRHGANGYVSKSSDIEEFLSALRELLLNKHYYSNDVKDFIDPLTPKNHTPHGILSKREFQVLLQLAQGMSNAAIAKSLAIHAKTVSSFRSRIMEKLKLNTNADLVRYGIRNRLVPFTDAQLSLEPVRQHTNHLVQFYKDDRYLISGIVEFIRQGIVANEGIAIISTAGHWEKICEELEKHSSGFLALHLHTRIRFLEVHETLEQILENGELNQKRFEQISGKLISEMKDRSERNRIYGEIVNVLCSMGKYQDAMALEGFWNDLLSKNETFSLLCGYKVCNVDSMTQGERFEGVCNQHSRWLPEENHRLMADESSCLHILGTLEMRLALDGTGETRTHRPRSKL